MGSLRRECLEHALILNDRHLLRVVREYTRYFNQERPIRESVNGFLTIMIGLCQTQLEMPHPRLSLGDYITAILGWLVRNNLYPFKF
jgi:hypothetical protein